MAATLVLAVGLAGGWVAARAFESPQQRSARAEPPAERALWYPLREGRLVDQVSGRGTIRPESTDPLVVPVQPALAVVTAVRVSAGEEVSQGQVVAEVNGGPVFVFSGAFPFYRDLRVGLTGPDVTELQTALGERGSVIPGAELGSFGAGTAAAVRKLYADQGYVPTADLPLGAVVHASALPERVVSRLRVGTRLVAEGPVVILGRGPLVAGAPLDAGSVVRIRRGMPARVLRDGVEVARATVVATTRGDAGTGVQVRPVRPFDPALAGRRIVVIVDVEVVARRGLLVPSRAVVTDGSGAGEILVRSRRSGQHRVPVRVLGELAGVSAVVGTGSESLAPGDQVRVG